MRFQTTTFQVGMFQTLFYTGGAVAADYGLMIARARMRR